MGNNIGLYQNYGYKYIINSITEGDQAIPNFENMESFGYTLLQRPLEGLNMIYPDKRLETGEKLDIKELVGKGGLKRIVKYIEEGTPQVRRDYEYINEDYGEIFSPGEIEKYSSKIHNIVSSIKNSEGIVMIYSQYIDGGLVPIALALESIGFRRSGNGFSLFKSSGKVKEDFKQYIMITGDKSLSPDNVNELKLATNIDNKDGKNVKVVLISQAGAEGLDFKCIRQLHIMEPWYNMNRIEQIIGRSVRHCSHKNLPFSKRNVQLYLYGTILEDNTEAADLYVYRLAELKAVQIGRVSRLLKQVSVDCLLNIKQKSFTVENLNQIVKQELSNKQVIDFAVGDKPYSAICDYLDKCDYKCKPKDEILEKDVNMYTYNENFLFMNNENIIRRIKLLFKERFFYTKKDLIDRINAIKNYSIYQINAALEEMIENRNDFLIDKYGRLGNLINIGELYLYKPRELTGDGNSLYELKTPLEYKKPYLTFDTAEESKGFLRPELKEKLDKIESTNNLYQKIKENYKLAMTDQTLGKAET